MEKKKSKTRKILVILFIVLFAIFSFINLKGSYLEYKELGENYIQIFKTNLNYKLIIFGVNFVLLYMLIYLTNKGIQKGLKPFFEKENKEFPKFLNKSIAFIMSILISTFMTKVLMQKILVCTSNVSFGITDPIFNFDISFYMFQKPLIETMIGYFIGIVFALTVYMVIYYIIIFNKYFNGIDGEMVKNSLLVKKIMRNVILIVIGVSLFTALNITNISFGKMLTIKNDTDSTQNIDVIGAGYTDVMIQRWGYLVFSVIMIIVVARAVKAFKASNFPKVLKNLVIIPGYLVAFFLVMIVFDLIFVNTNTLDKEKEYLAYNIDYTKNAYNIDLEETNLENTGTITQEEVEENKSIINNTNIMDSEVILKTLEDTQTGTGYYSYRSANLAQYKISGENKLVYISTREMANSGRTYNSKTYEYTHGIGQIVTSATNTTETGGIQYLQKDITGKDDKLGTTKQNIYFGLETNDTIATNTKNKQEYDYTDEYGVDHTSNYDGKAGLQLNFFDKAILGIKTGDLKLAFSSEVTKESKILINRNIIKRAKSAMPYLIYDENAYTVVTEDGSIVWVLDAYTTSGRYPYAQYTSIEHDGIKEKINYIRNSVKVIIDTYDGSMKFYITDKTDPIVMAYRNTYPSLFENLDTEIPEDISEHFIYPKFLFDVQAELLKAYHNVKPDILYRNDDLWNFAKYNSTVMTKSSGTILESYYTMVNDEGKSEVGLLQTYTPDSKQNLISYVIGTTDGYNNKLKLYKYSQDSNILGPMQLDNQIEQDEVISSQIKSLNTTGTKVTKNMVMVPIKDTVLYVEAIYQTMLNEESKIPMLKKVVVASGNKVAIGNNLVEAVNNLLSKEAFNIEVENTGDINGAIDAIIKANKNLTESTNNKDWELMGSDIKKLQALINTLEELKVQEEKKKEQEKNEIDSNTINEVGNENIVEE
ncbi:MAG: UPF0182 family protein [Clostridia bacterium]|nr:UPF0182 family protein [Clostridia bacterium]